MGFVVSMIRKSVEPGGRDRFECSDEAWELLLNSGKAFGWKPWGTSYTSIDSETLSTTQTLHDYRPGDSRDRKYIGSDDAHAWAAALKNARGSPHFSAMVDARSDLSVHRVVGGDGEGYLDAATASFIDEFIEYAFGGAFSFARAA
jgi:hypothetical protein